MQQEHVLRNTCGFSMSTAPKLAPTWVLSMHGVKPSLPRSIVHGELALSQHRAEIVRF